MRLQVNYNYFHAIDDTNRIKEKLPGKDGDKWGAVATSLQLHKRDSTK